MRRITLSTAELLKTAPAQLQRMDELRRKLGDLRGWSLLAENPAPGTLTDLGMTVARRIRRPRGLAPLLDESPEADVEVLAALVEIDAAGLLRRLKADGRSVTFESPEQVDLVSAHAARARAAGFAGPARIIFAGTHGALALLAHAASRLDETVGQSAPAPDAPIPYEMATLWAADDASVQLVALPLDAAYSPLWPLTLAGASAVVAVNELAMELLSGLCASSGVPLYDARTRISDWGAPEPRDVAALVRGALGAGPDAAGVNR